MVHTDQTKSQLFES